MQCALMARFTGSCAVVSFTTVGWITIKFYETANQLFKDHQSVSRCETILSSSPRSLTCLWTQSMC